jgi:ABC-2 type transport system ATP-binding protein
MRYLTLHLTLLYILTGHHTFLLSDSGCQATRPGNPFFCKELPMIEVEGLTKDYGKRRAIENLSFSAEKGEILGFLGPNGAGKTTTMRILSGYMPPSSGTARIGGYDIIQNSIDVRRIVGYLPETVPLYNDMTVFSYLKYMADLRHLVDSDGKVEEVLERVHMEDRADGYIANLSKGMRQRIGLAQALLHSPEVLILDEPTIGLDPGQIIEVRNLIKEIGKEKTVLLSTHILSEAQQVCDRVLIINNGRIVVEDSPEHLQMRLTGAQHVMLRVTKNVDELLPSINKINGVEAVKKISEDTLEINVSPAIDARPDIARTTLKKGYDLLELRAINLSLEDIFLELTRDNTENPDLVENVEDGFFEEGLPSSAPGSADQENSVYEQE